MPREIRLIVFDRDEVVSALRDFLVSRREIESVDQVEVTEISLATNPGVSAVILRGTARSKRSLRGAELAAAMISFCLKHRIPLPHKTHKSLRPFADGVALSFSQGIGPGDFDLVLHSKDVAGG